MKKIYLTNEQIAAFFAEFYSLRQADIAEKEALQIMAEGCDKKAMQPFLTTLINAPNLLSGLEQFPELIPEYILILLREAEEKSIEMNVLADIATHLEQLTATESGIPYRQQLKSCFSYPIIVLVVLYVVTNILLIFVIPVFADLFKGFGAQLPALTQFVVNASEYARENIWLFLIGVVLPVTLYLKSAYSAGVKSLLLLNFPGIACLTRQIETAAIIETCYLLCRYQFTLAQALRLSATTTRNTLIIAALIECADKLTKGDKLIDSLKSIPLFSTKTVLLLAAFERTQQLQILKNLAQSYHKQIPRQFVLFMRVLQVILLIGCAMIVGIAVIAMYLPIFTMGEAV